MKSLLAHLVRVNLCLVLLLATAVSSARGQAVPPDEGLDPLDPALLSGLLPDDDYAPTVTALGVSGPAFVISWKGDGVLQVSDGPNGPWRDLWNATSPFSVPLADSKVFLRVRIPGLEVLVDQHRLRLL